MKTKILASLAITGLIFASCGGNKDEKKGENTEKSKVEETDSIPADDYEYSYDVAEEEVEAKWIVSIMDKGVTMDKIAELLGKNYTKIFGTILKMDAQDGAPVAIYHNWQGEGQPFDIESAIPVNDSTIKVSAPMELKKSYAGKVVSVIYMGNYEDMKTAYDDIMHYIEVNGLTYNGSAWEEYITDPMEEKDTSKWQTNIYFPVK